MDSQPSCDMRLVALGNCHQHAGVLDPFGLLIAYRTAVGQRARMTNTCTTGYASPLRVCYSQTLVPRRVKPVQPEGIITNPPNNRLQAAVGGLGGGMPARWAFAHRA